MTHHHTTNKFMLLFGFVAFVVGGMVYASGDILTQIGRMEGFADLKEIEGLEDQGGDKKDNKPNGDKDNKNQKEGDKDSKPNGDNDNCPDVMVQKGQQIVLYNTKKPDQAPIVLKNLDEYATYREKNPSSSCPILYLKQENNAQGQDVYRRIIPGTGAPGTFAEPIKVLDASRDNGYNTGMYAGFDPYGLHVGQFTEVDRIHYSTEFDYKVSDNPMDTNWGGVLHTQSSVDSGKYDENNVEPPRYATPKGGAFFAQRGESMQFPIAPQQTRISSTNRMS